MKLVVNGKEMHLAEGATLPDVLGHMDVDDTRGVAVAVDDEVVPRSEWGSMHLIDGQRVEVLRAVQGG